MENKSNFVSLKAILPILAIILFTAFSAQSQVAKNNPGEPVKVLKSYPNPASSFINFEVQKNFQKGLSIAVFSSLGTKVSDIQNVTEKTTLSLMDYNRGMYIYRLMDPAGKVIDTGKFQVSK